VDIFPVFLLYQIGSGEEHEWKHDNPKSDITSNRFFGFPDVDQKANEVPNRLLVWTFAEFAGPHQLKMPDC
jgi:hypothetical protein